MRFAKLLLVLAALSVALLATTPAQAQYRGLKHTYEHYYWKASHKIGRQHVGRNIVRRGIRTKHGAHPASRKHIARSIRTFKRWLAPPPAPIRRNDRSSASAAPAYAGGGYSIPRSIVMCESGGNYRAVNPSSGAGGAYQILPSTWQAYGGTGSPQNASPAEQDRIAAKVWAGQGRGAWVC